MLWAEQIALVLAAWWMRSRAGGTSDAPGLPPPAHDSPVLGAPPPVPAPDPDAPRR